MLMWLKIEGTVRTAVQMATNSAFVDEGQPVEAQPYLISKVGMYHPDPMIDAPSFVTLEALREPSVYISIDCWYSAVKELLRISKCLMISSLRAELSARADLINWLSRLSTAIIGRFVGKSRGNIGC